MKGGARSSLHPATGSRSPRKRVSAMSEQRKLSGQPDYRRNRAIALTPGSMSDMAILRQQFPVGMDLW